MSHGFLKRFIESREIYYLTRKIFNLLLLRVAHQSLIWKRTSNDISAYFKIKKINKRYACFLFLDRMWSTTRRAEVINMKIDSGERALKTNQCSHLASKSKLSKREKHMKIWKENIISNVCTRNASYDLMCRIKMRCVQMVYAEIITKHYVTNSLRFIHATCISSFPQIFSPSGFPLMQEGRIDRNEPLPPKTHQMHSKSISSLIICAQFNAFVFAFIFIILF